MTDHHHHHDPPSPGFPVAADGLPQAVRPAVVDLADGDRFALRVAPVAARIGGRTVRRLAYNGAVPGPTLRVPEGARIDVALVNDGDLETTVHWHGLRLENRFDGTHETQDPVPVGGSYTARVAFPDPGVYWYHPHIRQDYGQELGLAGACVVVPADPGYWPPADREEVVTLDDVLLDEDGIAPFRRDEPTHVAMGRYGDAMLVSGEVEPVLEARPGEVVRFYLVNTANARVFRVGIPGAAMKLVGGDSGRVEREEMIEEVVIAPSERAVVDVLFPDRPGGLDLEHRGSGAPVRLASVAVEGAPMPATGARRDFAALRTDDDLRRMRDDISPLRAAAPHHTLSLVAEMDMGHAEGGYACPMHPEVRAMRPERCPLCGMKLVPAQMVGASAHDHAHHGGHHDAGHGAGDGGRDDRIEWEDDMADLNRLTTPSNTRWHLVDADTGARGAQIAWRLRVGDRVVIRLVNETDSDHPMQHPFHVHGAGRFLVLARDGVADPNLVWKDTVLVRTGETVDILLDVTNPGRWMAHCHIAEHHEGGMMFSFDVDPA